MKSAMVPIRLWLISWLRSRAPLTMASIRGIHTSTSVCHLIRISVVSCRISDQKKKLFMSFQSIHFALLLWIKWSIKLELMTIHLEQSIILFNFKQQCITRRKKKHIVLKQTYIHFVHISHNIAQCFHVHTTLNPFEFQLIITNNIVCLFFITNHFGIDENCTITYAGFFSYMKINGIFLLMLAS